MHDLTFLFDMLGVAFFAIAGALSAGRKRMDLFGVLVLGCVAALGGGTLRDVILGAYPIFWIEAPYYFVLAVVAAACTFFMARRWRPPVRLMMYADAGGLAVFTVIGFQKGFLVSQSYGVAIVMGVVTGVVGGIVRDVLSGEVPLIFRREIYASASLCGAVFLALVSRFYEFGPLAVAISVSATLAIRLSAIRWKISLPVFVLDDHDGMEVNE